MRKGQRGATDLRPQQIAGEKVGLTHWTAGTALAASLLLVLFLPGSAVAQPCIVDQVTDTTGDPNLPNSNEESTISSDGLWIAFQSNAEPVPASNPDGNFEVWLYDVAGDSFSQITVTGSSGNVRPAISGDGLWVAFEGSPELFPSGTSPIALYDVAGASILQITNTLAGSSRYPEVNGNGTLVSFVSNTDIVAGGNPDGNPELFLYDRTAGTFIQVTTTVGGQAEISSLDAAGNLLAFSSTADIIAGGHVDGNSEVFLYDVPTATTTQITNTLGGGSYSPDLSHDGAWLALQSNRDLVAGGNLDANIEVFLYDNAGATFSQVTNLTGLESYAPSLNQDGTRLAFASFNDPTGANPDANNELFLFDVLTSEITQITDTTGPSFFYMMGVSLSGDGERIAFDSYSNVTGSNGDGNREVYLASCGTAAFGPAIPVASGWGLVVFAVLTVLAAIRVLLKATK